MSDGFVCEKYGDNVRAIKFGDSMESCGESMSAIPLIFGLKIAQKAFAAAGIRRIEAITGEG
jgi:alanyl-tRNA synthetase